MKDGRLGQRFQVTLYKYTTFNRINKNNNYNNKDTDKGMDCYPVKGF